MLLQNFITMSAAVHELSSTQTFLPYLNQSINQSKHICIAPCRERIRGAYGKEYKNPVL